MEKYKIPYVWPKFEYFWLQSHLIGNIRQILNIFIISITEF